MTLRWTWLEVEDRMIAAESTLRRLPDVTLKSMHGAWPDIVREHFESYGYVDNRIRIRPSARDIDHMREAMEWLLWISETDRRVVWGRAEMKPWRRLAGENRLTVPDAQLAWMAGLLGIAHRLNTPARVPVRQQLMAMPVSRVYAVPR